LLNELRGIVVVAHDGDAKALSRLREILKELPSLANIFADLADKAEQVAEEIAASDEAFAESWESLQSFRADYARWRELGYLK
jgi:TRAP-type mannitol/chloroaromatic compound transport system substrate-binding protein